MADTTAVALKNFKAWKSIMDLATQMHSCTKKPITHHPSPITSPS
jgi:hypothetical protein